MHQSIRKHCMHKASTWKNVTEADNVKITIKNCRLGAKKDGEKDVDVRNGDSKIRIVSLFWF